MQYAHSSSGPYREDREMTDNGIGECARVERGTDDEAPHAQGAACIRPSRASLLNRRRPRIADNGMNECARVVEGLQAQGKRGELMPETALPY